MFLLYNLFAPLTLHVSVMNFVRNHIIESWFCENDTFGIAMGVRSIVTPIWESPCPTLNVSKNLHQDLFVQCLNFEVIVVQA